MSSSGLGGGIQRLWQEKRETIGQFLRFCMVGGSGVVVDLGITALCTEIIGVPPLYSGAVGFCFAVVNNYLLNRLWTFKKQVGTSRAFSFSSFFLIALGGLAISEGIMHLCMQQFGWKQLPWYLVARFSGIVVATMWNFLGSKYIAFRGKNEPAAQ